MADELGLYNILSLERDFILRRRRDDNIICTGPAVAMMVLIPWDNAASSARTTTDRDNIG